MRFKWIAVLWIPLFGDPLIPATPVAITTSSDVISPTFACANNSGFLATWKNNTTSIMTSFSPNNGSSWNTAVAVTHSSTLYPRVSAGASTIVVTWGGMTMAPCSNYSLNNGASWSPVVFISHDVAAGIDIPVCANNQGFLVTYTDNGSSNAYAAFSVDGAIWSTKVQVNATAGSVSTNFSTSCAGLGNVFIAAWMDNDSNLQASMSSNNGLTWSAPVALTSDGSANSEISLSATNSGFLASWNNTSGNAYSSFSIDNGLSWGAPVLISTGLEIDGNFSLGASGSAYGFVSAWQSTDSTAFASLSSNNGLSWSSPVEVSPISSLDEEIPNMVGACFAGNNCLFTWTDNTGNAVSSLSLTLGQPPRPSSRPNHGR